MYDNRLGLGFMGDWVQPPTSQFGGVEAAFLSGRALAQQAQNTVAAVDDLSRIARYWRPFSRQKAHWHLARIGQQGHRCLNTASLQRRPVFGY